MDQANGQQIQVSTEDLFTKIGAQTIELDVLRNRLGQAEQIIGSQKAYIKDLQDQLNPKDVPPSDVGPTSGDPTPIRYVDNPDPKLPKTIAPE